MRTTTVRRAMLAGAAFIAALALVACGSDDNGGGSTTSPTAPAQEEFNDADVAFAQNMIMHHEQAIEMAELAETRVEDEELAQMASDIRATQQPEITILTDLLTEWGQPTEPEGGHAGMSMPGMATEDQMAELEAASGAEFDRMFAQMMVSHHGGAVQMAQEVQDQGVNPEVNVLAATMEEQQSAEVETLEQILDRL